MNDFSDESLQHRLDASFSSLELPGRAPDGRYQQLSSYRKNYKRIALLGGLPALLTTKLAAAAAAATLLAAGTVAATVTTSSTSTSTTANWGATVTQAVASCKAALASPSASASPTDTTSTSTEATQSHGIGRCVSAIAKQHGPAERALHSKATSHPTPQAGHGTGHPTGKP